MDELGRRAPDMVEQLEALVCAESSSDDLAALGSCADTLAEVGVEVLGVAPERLVVDGKPHLRWRFGATTPRITLVGHFDTVWPTGTIDRWPFAVDGDIATGPGVFDMKAGIVQGFHALSLLDDLDGCELLLTSDEELGSQSSRALVEDSARASLACLVLEPAADGALKIARKGTSMYRFVLEGRASHAGLEPEKGANALVAAAQLIAALPNVARPALGTTVTPTVCRAGTTTNVVPAHAVVDVDARASLPEEQARVDEELRALAPNVPGCRLTVEGGPNRPPLPETAALALFDRAAALADQIGLGPVRAVAVGGGSDGNFTAGVGTPTLDGLGAVGAGAHAEGEHVVLSEMPRRAALLRALLEDLRARPPERSPSA